MPDIYSNAKRSFIMSRIRSNGTESELLVRKYLFAKGYRYRKNFKDLIGSPDIVFPKSKFAIFIHGCFWHGHDCKKGTRPTTHTEFWNKKIQSNINRDMRVVYELEKAGWNVITLWSCELKNKETFEGTMNNLIGKLSKISP